jgi:hypothetical protein
MAALLAGTFAFGANAAQAATTYHVTLPGGTGFDFRSQPRWVTVPEARGVYVVRDDMRPDRDYFRYRGSYYVYSNGTWYRANRWNGRYTVVSERRLPRVFYSVRQDRWRAYPNGWDRRRM